MKRITYIGKQFTGEAYVGSRGPAPATMEIVCEPIQDGLYRACARMDGYTVGVLYIKPSGEIDYIEVPKKMRRRRIGKVLKDAMQRALDKAGTGVTVHHSDYLTDYGALWAGFETGRAHAVTAAVD
jgi:hypothetical protein